MRWNLFCHFVGRAEADPLKELAISLCQDQRADDLDSSLMFAT